MSFLTFFDPPAPPLEDLPYERYLRIIGLVNALPLVYRQQPNYRQALSEFERLRKELEADVDQTARRFRSSDAADQVHNLNILFLQFVPREYLAFQIGSLREEFRDSTDEVTFAAYQASPALQDLGCAKIDDRAAEKLDRADATFLATQTRRYTLLKKHVQTTKRFLILSLSRITTVILVPLLAMVLLFLVAHHSYNRVAGQEDASWLKHSAQRKAGEEPKPSALYQAVLAATVLSLAGIAGTLGAYVSVLSRVQKIDDSPEVGKNIWTLRNSEITVLLAPLTGFLFAGVLSLLLAGGLVSGSLFPKTFESGWIFVIYYPTELAKWMVWAFLAGFSERLVPDLLDRLTAATKQNSAASAVGAIPTAALPAGAGPGGTAKNKASSEEKQNSTVDLPASRLSSAAVAHATGTADAAELADLPPTRTALAQP